MSLRKAETMDVPKGSQEPWGVMRSPFENRVVLEKLEPRTGLIFHVRMPGEPGSLWKY